jgi:transcriptional regulator with XRE-family HTH domain
MSFNDRGNHRVASSGELNQVLQQIGAFRSQLKPRGGWLRLTRLYSRVSAGEVARRMGVSRQLPLQFERAEANNSITLKSLRSMADALGYELVYALVPKIKKPPPVLNQKRDVQVTDMNSAMELLRKLI